MKKKKTTITISTGLRNRIRHSKFGSFAGGYEDFLSRLMDRDKFFTNEEKKYTNKDNLEQLQQKRNKLNREISTLKKATLKH